MDEPQSLCKTCQTIDIAQYFSDQDPGNTSIGNFQDILKNESCTFCKLVIQALSVHTTRHWQPGKYPIEECYIGRYSGDLTPGRVEVWFDATSKTLPDGHWGHSTILGRIKCLDNTQPRLLGERLNYSLLRSWIDDCASHHGPKCNPSRSNSDSLGLLLIDVKRMRLFQCDQDRPYLALSYVWGKAKQFQTVKSNFQQLQQDGALLKVRDQLPRLINDAITFVADLGESYLWVDALCIVQDDDVVKAHYIPRMDEIYGRALVTIVALAGSNVNYPLPGVMTGSRALSHSPVQLRSLTLVPEPPSLARAVESSTWNTRGWTLQEEVLAKKRLYFSDSQAYWQCSDSYQSEGGGGETNAVTLSSRSTNELEQEVGDDPRQRFNVYRSLAMQYAGRTLTYPSDSLNAFVGILSALRDSFGWRFASALPEQRFDLALLWTPIFRSRLRPREPLAPACRSPTWCWTAWEKNIYWNRWRLYAYVGKLVTLKTEVKSFIIKDKGGVRWIIRDDREAQPRCPPTLSEAFEMIDLDDSSTTPALIFDAPSVGVDMYTISAPQPDPSRATQPFSDFFTNTLRGQLWIYDAAGHHCGSIRGPATWAPSEDGFYEFVLLSRSDQDKVTQADVDGYRDNLPLEYPSAEEYYEEVFDTSVYEHKPWWALNILLVEWKGDLAERVAAGQLHVDAWHTSQKMKSFVLV
ncbi:hypothetical protein NM208_g5667 [Fusarium decemcellulare]|uniref:Uncharacterized protein n=1 Tax=Fusarium decemcellulare TaxID=57161 RepID=A0ACC1SG06_9HYPO|nr:hypothetical protein NM208_g5667 [Fusarium decemcellulare]